MKNRFEKNPYRGRSNYRSKRVVGISIHEIAFWVDGKGQADKKNGRPYIFVDCNEGTEAHGGRWIDTSATSTIAVGNNGEYISSCWFWLHPDRNDVADETLINFDGGTNTITRSLADIETTIPNATIYVNGEIGNETDETRDYFIFVTWTTPVLASNVTITSGLDGRITNVMAFTVQVPLYRAIEYYNLTSEAPIPVPSTADVLKLEDGSDILLETGFDFLLETAEWNPIPPVSDLLLETGDLVLKEDGYTFLQEQQ